MVSGTIDLRHEITADQGRFSIAIGVFFFVLATALGAFVRVPLYGTPVPLTLQTFFVLLSGAFLGRRWGAASQMLYIALGLCGLPIFQGSAAGFAHLAGPTGGYLAGFVVSSFLVGHLVKRYPSGYGVTAALLAGSLVILGFGSLWLMAAFRLSPVQAFMAGCAPFLPGDMLKVAVASALCLKLSPRIRQIFTL